MSKPETNPILDTLFGPTFVQEGYLALDATGSPHISLKRRNLLAQVLELPHDKVATYSWLGERVVIEAEEEVALARASGEFV